MTFQQGDPRRALRRSDCESWARHVLDIPADAPEDVVRHAVLTRLAQSQFTPPEPWRDAACLLARPQAELWIGEEAGESCLRTAEEALRQRIFALSHRFFDLHPGQRRDEWTQLVRAAAISPPLAEHLAWLEAGLDVQFDHAISGDPKLQELTDHIAATFPLPAPMRAAADLQLLQRAAMHQHAWRGAVRRLQKRSPRIAALAPRLVRTLESGDSVEKAKALARKPWRRTIGGSNDAAAKHGRVSGFLKVTGQLALLAAFIAYVVQSLTHSGSTVPLYPHAPPKRSYPPYSRPADAYAPAPSFDDEPTFAPPAYPAAYRPPRLPSGEPVTPTTSWKPLQPAPGASAAGRSSGYQPFAPPASPAPAGGGGTPWRR